MIFEPRTYRNSFSKERFQSFVITCNDSDLWIGVDPASYKDEMSAVALKKLTAMQSELEVYIAGDSFFKKSLKPCDVQENAPDFVRSMAEAAEKAGVGPMAAVSGMFSELIGRELLENFSIDELVVVNGGDIYMKLQKSQVMTVFAGESPLSGMVGLEIDAEQTPLGICTFAQTEQTPMNFGKADAVIIVCKDAALADAFTTGFGNLIKKPADVEKVLKRTERFEEVISAVLICDDQIGIRGEFEIKLLS
ncbi:UPF0280 family protein [Sunxiuqinia indica]|uniref:UPF0280 family protein n=1 Tax=Sunxiuqinia indica TaxID=2692584 RepID=UPI001357DBAC|nr:UPF0280 family protein [Sunxiuqinia indica]